MNYAEMTDSEINKNVAERLGALFFYHDGVPYYLRENPYPSLTGVDLDEVEFNPCNSWGDAGPIIQEFLISLNPRCANGEWKASAYLGRDDIFDQYASSWDKNPLRAAMIAFVMMKDSGK